MKGLRFEAEWAPRPGRRVSEFEAGVGHGIPIITGRFPLAEARDVVLRASKRQDGKVMVRI